ncbi:SAVED domain-containing protein [Thermovibrio sp.]
MVLKSLIEEGKITAALAALKDWVEDKVELKREELLYAANSGNPEILYWIVKGALERDREFLEKVIGAELLSEPVEFEFPVVGSKNKMVKAIAFKSSKEVKNKKDASLEPVKEFLNSEVAVFFEETNFSGSSFQAPLAYALLAGGIPEKVAISGKLESSGDFIADRVKEKRKLARKLRKFLIWKGNVKELHTLLSQKEIELPFLIATIPYEEVKATFKLLQETAGVKTVKGLDGERLSVVLPPKLPAGRWEEFVKRVVESLREVRELTYSPIKAKIHLGIRAPSALAFAIGATLGAGKIPLAIYHFENQNYYKLIDLIDSPRKIKRRIRTLSRFTMKSELKGKKKAVVALQIASHETEKRARALAEELDADFFYAEHKNKGALPKEPSEWEETVAEAYEVMNRVYNSSEYEEINLLMSVPVAIAFALGMAVDNYWPIKVWQYFKEKGDYLPVLELPKLEKVDSP